MQMRRLSHNNRISHSDIHIRFSNVRPNLSVATSFDTGNGRILSKRVHRPENVPEVQKNHYIIPWFIIQIFQLGTFVLVSVICELQFTIFQQNKNSTCMRIHLSINYYLIMAAPYSLKITIRRNLVAIVSLVSFSIFSQHIFLTILASHGCTFTGWFNMFLKGNGGIHV